MVRLTRDYREVLLSSGGMPEPAGAVPELARGHPRRRWDGDAPRGTGAGPQPVNRHLEEVALWV